MRIFISYGRKDAADIAVRLAEWLRRRGDDPFLDVEKGIPIGARFDVRIEVGISGSKLLIALLSPWSVREEGFCRNELLYAQAKGVPIVPMRVADVIPPIQIISVNYIDACDDPEAAFEQLPAAIEEVASTGKSQLREDWPAAAEDGAWWASPDELSFEEELARHGDSFVGREWLFDEAREWVAQSESRLLLLSGDAGVGKSAIAAQMTAQLNVHGLHFCSGSNPKSCRPDAWLAGLVYQLAARFRGYREQIERSSRPNWGESGEALFRTLIADPLRECQDQLDMEEPWVFVIDGLDEAVAHAGWGLADLLADSAERIPEWLRLVVTSRPDQALLARFRVEGVRHDHLDAESERNRADLRDHIARGVQRMVAEQIIADRPETIPRLSEACAGNFLFARMTLAALGDPDPECRLSLEEIGDLPPQLEGLYNRMFRKRFRDMDRYEGETLPLLDCLIAARGPLPEKLLLAAAGVEQQTARRGLRALSQFLSRRDTDLRMFHQSVAEWLTDSEASAEFEGFPARGHERLAQACWEEFKQGASQMSDYARAHMPTHLAEAARWQDLLSAISSPELGLIERWVDQADADQGVRCLTGVIEHAGLEPVHAAALATQVARIHSLRGEYEEARRWLEYAIARTSWRRGRRTRAVALHEMGSLHLYHQEMTEATRAYRQALRLCTRGSPVYRDEAAANRIGLATIAFLEYRWSQVLRLARQALGEAESVSDFRHAIAAQRLIGMALEDLGRYDEAEAKLNEGLLSSRREAVAVEEARLLSALACFSYAQAQLREEAPTEAARYFREAMEASRRIHNLYSMLDARLRLGWCALANGATVEASEWFEQVLGALPRDVHPDLMVGSRVGLAAAAHQWGSLEEAEQEYRDMIILAEDYDFKGWAAVALVGLGATCWHTGQADDAQSAWGRARRHAKDTSPRAQQLTEANIRLCKAAPNLPPR